jgi:outer membrane protein TolC
MKTVFLCLLILLAVGASGLEAGQAPGGQPPAGEALTVEQAVELALANYPAIRAAQAQVSAAGAGIELARTAYLPRTDLLWQANRATRNNVFGLLLPQSVVPPISGPVLGASSLSDTVWGTASGALLSWEPFDFGLRRAGVRVAETARDQASAELAVTRLDVAAGAADAFLTLLAAQERVRAARANVDRTKVFADSVGVLVNNQLRPGAEESRARAELAAAQTGLIQAEQVEQIARAALAQAMGIAGASVAVAPGPLLRLPEQAPAAPQFALHPLVRAQTLAVDLARAREQVLARSFFPRFNFQSAIFGRGTGAKTDGRTLGGLNGLAPDTPNWAAGITVTFPIFDYASLRARKKVETFREQAESARYDQLLQNLTAQAQKARALIDGARRITGNTPLQLEAARTTERQARARYEAGLATVVEVAEAQRLLAQAEVEDALARLGVWRALLAAALASGDLEPFLKQAR